MSVTNLNYDHLAALARSAVRDLDLDYATRCDCEQHVIEYALEHPEKPTSFLWWEARRHALEVLFDRSPKDPPPGERAWAIGETFYTRADSFDLEVFEHEIRWLLKRARARGGQRTEAAALRDYRILLMNRYCDTQQEIADALGISLAQVKKSLQFSRQVFSQFLQEQSK